MNRHSYTVNIAGELLELSPDAPIIMGILNHTPDSFYSNSRIRGEEAIHARITQILSEGGRMVDVGGYSTRPDAAEVTAAEEWQRIQPVLRILRTQYPEAIVSVDTFRAEVARLAVEEEGAHIINDVSGGRLDPKMHRVVGQLGVPYILMHMRGTPSTMQQLTQYPDGRVADGVISEMLLQIESARSAGIKDIILDPGFGFSKTLEQNYQLMHDLSKFAALDAPLLVGVSRKSMIYKLFGTSPQEALNGTTVLHTYALLGGVTHILRVHDVREASEVARMVSLLTQEA